MSAEVTAPSGMVDSGMGATALSSNALPIGTRVHEFEITRIIGEGGFSIVYLAFDHTLHRSIALKEYIPSALAGRRGDNTVAVRSAQHQQTFEAGLRSFINESRLLAQFDHPALVKVYRFWEANGTAYMAMPYYEGRTLKQILREHPEQASETWLKQLLGPILDALELLHRHRCYHRDIAPDNIQVLDNQAPVLLDFGAARRTIGDMTQAFTVILKPGYAPIEQYADEADLKQGPWTDVYALAAVLYAAVVRKPPPTAVARVIRDPLEPLSKRSLPMYSQQFLAGIDRGLAVRPEARPQSIDEIRQLLGVQGHGYRHAELDSQIVAAAARNLEQASSPVPGTSATPVPASGVSTDSVPTILNIGEPLGEKDRTVLVPGLRRTVHRTLPDDVKRPNAQADRTPGHRVNMPRFALFSRPTMLAGIAVIVAVIVALVVFLGREAAPTIAGQQPAASASAGTADKEPPARVPPTSDEALPAPSAAEKPAEAELKTPASPAVENPVEGWPKPPAQQREPPSPATTASAEQTSKDRTLPPSVSPSAGSQPEAVQPSARQPPAVSADERRWAAIKDSDRIADFLAFQLKYPNSPRSPDATARINELERLRPQEKSRAEASAGNHGKAQSGTGDDRARVTQAEPPARIPAAGTGAKAVVRVRVRPFGYVYVDGALIGASPPVQQIEVGPGRHRIEARNPEARPPIVSTEIDVTGAQPRDVQLRFIE